MKMMKDLRALSDAELLRRAEEFKKELLKATVQAASGSGGASAGTVRKSKRAIARVNTLLKQREGL